MLATETAAEYAPDVGEAEATKLTVLQLDSPLTWIVPVLTDNQVDEYTEVGDDDDADETGLGEEAADQLESPEAVFTSLDKDAHAEVTSSSTDTDPSYFSTDTESPSPPPPPPEPSSSFSHAEQSASSASPPPAPEARPRARPPAPPSASVPPARRSCDSGLDLHEVTDEPGRNGEADSILVEGGGDGEDDFVSDDFISAHGEVEPGFDDDDEASGASFGEGGVAGTDPRDLPMVFLPFRSYASDRGSASERGSSDEELCGASGVVVTDDRAIVPDVPFQAVVAPDYDDDDHSLDGDDPGGIAAVLGCVACTWTSDDTSGDAFDFEEDGNDAPNLIGCVGADVTCCGADVDGRIDAGAGATRRRAGRDGGSLDDEWLRANMTAARDARGVRRCGRWNHKYGRDYISSGWHAGMT